MLLHVVGTLLFFYRSLGTLFKRYRKYVLLYLVCDFSIFFFNRQHPSDHLSKVVVDALDSNISLNSLNPIKWKTFYLWWRANIWHDNTLDSVEMPSGCTIFTNTEWSTQICRDGLPWEIITTHAAASIRVDNMFDVLNSYAHIEPFCSPCSFIIPRFSSSDLYFFIGLVQMKLACNAHRCISACSFL